MTRRLIRLVGLSLIAALLMPGTASAESVKDLRAQLERLKRDTASAGEAYSDAHWALDESDVRLGRIDRRIRASNKELAQARVRLNEHATSIYRREALDYLDFLLGASDYQALVTRMDLLGRIGESGADAIIEVRILGEQLRAERKLLAKERSHHAKEAKRLRARRNALQKRLTSKEADFKRVKAKLDRARSGGRTPSGVASVAGPNGMVFPVVGSYYYSNTWGASRSGGRRRHQGTDIMAPRGTPVVAIVSGSVRSKSNRLGGKTIWLRGSNGWSYYYAHLDRYVVSSGSVRAGQAIATVGSTGNASASSPHLHLQIHPSGPAVNPYPYLRAME